MTSESLNFLRLSPLRPLNILARSSFVWRSQAKARGSVDVAKLLPCAHIPWKAAIRTVFTQEDDAAGAIAWRHVADPLRPRFLKLAALMDDAETDVLAFMSFPRAHWPKLHSTNPLERLYKEVKRRANVVGIFPNEASVKRLVGAILLEQNDEWQLQHRYMTLETMNGLSDDPIGTLPSYAIKAA
jgi:putative transposase